MSQLAHAQVFFDQEANECRIFFGDAVLLAKQLHIGLTQIGVVAAAPFGNVMKNTGGIEHPGFVKGGCQLRAERVLVGMFGHKKAPHIAQHHQDVLVHRVHMEQVVLHLAHDAPKHPQVPPQHRGVVHQAQRMHHALALGKQAHEHLPVDGVFAESPVHHMTCVVKPSERACRQAFGALCGLVHPKGFQNGVGVLQVHIVLVDVDVSSQV